MLKDWRKGQRISFLVAEPWDFTSSDGRNCFRCKILSRHEYEGKSYYLAEVISTFQKDGDPVRFILLSARSGDSYNGAYVSEVLAHRIMQNAQILTEDYQQLTLDCICNPKQS